MVMWGSVDEGATIYHDARVKQFLEKMAEEAHWSESKVHAVKPAEPLEQPLPMTIPEASASNECLKDGEEGTLLGPVEGRVVRGSDNRLYAVDFLHVAPVDVAWRKLTRTVPRGGGVEAARASPAGDPVDHAHGAVEAAHGEHEGAAGEEGEGQRRCRT